MEFWTRRALMRRAALATAGRSLLGGSDFALSMQRNSMTMAHNPHTMDASRLEAFVDALPIPVLQSAQGRQSSAIHGAVDALYYRVPIHEIACKLHRDLPVTRMWGYGETSAPVLFETRSGDGVLIHWENHLPEKHFLPLDMPMNGMENAPETRLSTHMHGARVPSISDGYPEDWYGPGMDRLCYYPNKQDAAALWMHDHAMGTGRFNIFAGLMGWYIIRDAFEDSLGLPSGKYELPLLLYDRSFTPEGQLYYPNPPDEGVWAQEYLGDAMLINGKVRPYHDVEPRTYRLRIVNTANSRFFSLALSNGQSFHVIGSDQGLLSAPIEMKRLVLAPAERTDIIVDFGRVPGERVQLISDRLDLMQFRVSTHPVKEIHTIQKFLRPVERIVQSSAIRNREMTLNQFDSDKGEPMVMLLNRKHWADPITEIVQLGSTEIWTLINLTEDTHPIHLHMVRFQILDRQSFADYEYLANDKILPTGEPTLPAPHERGWKDVVQCPPYTITRIIVPFQGFAGRFLWHCHILEHEANDMMRPYQIVS